MQLANYECSRIRVQICSISIQIRIFYFSNYECSRIISLFLVIMGVVLLDTIYSLYFLLKPDHINSKQDSEKFFSNFSKSRIHGIDQRKAMNFDYCLLLLFFLHKRRKRETKDVKEERIQDPQKIKDRTKKFKWKTESPKTK